MSTKLFRILRISSTAIVCIVTFSFATIVSSDELRFQAVWHSGSGTNIFTAPEPFSDFLDRGTELVDQGLRLIDVETAIVDNRRVYSGVWVAGSGGNIIVGPMSPIELREEREARTAQGLRLIDIEIFRRANGGRRYVGLWRSGTGRDLVTRPLEEDAFLSRGTSLTQQGLRLIDVEVERINGQLVYTGLWRDGTGSNLFTTPRRPVAFRELRDQMVADGLELVDVERIGRPGNQRFVGVFSSGDGESRLSRPRNLNNFLTFGSAQAQNGFRTRDMEMFVVAAAPDDGDDDPQGPSAPGATDAGLPDLPPWIQLSSNPHVVIDFGIMIETENGHEVPLMTIPTKPTGALPDFLPRKNDGQDLVFPDTFCGMNIKNLGSISWQVGEQIIDTPPFNHVPDVADIHLNPDFGNQNFLQAGIEFSGPIGGCEGSNHGWHFPIPITQTAPFEPLPNMKLVLGLMPNSQIRFIEHQPPEGEMLDAHELFSDEVFHHMEEMLKSFLLNAEIDNGLCGIDQYLEKICEEEGRNDPKCLVGEDFDSC